MRSNSPNIKLAALTSHPIQYQAPWFRKLAKRCDLTVFFAHRPDPHEQGEGFDTSFEWDVDLTDGFHHEFLENVSRRLGTGHFGGCDTPGIGAKLRAGAFDAVIVNGWYLKSYVQAWRACRRAGVPVLLRGDSQLGTPRSRLKQAAKKPLYRWFLGRIDGFLTVGKRNAEYLRHYGVPDSRLYPAPHFVDNDWFRERALAADRAAVRRAWAIPEGRPALLFVGKFISKKRPLDLLEAAALLPTEKRPALVFVGSGELEGALRAKAGSLAVDAVFPGFLNQSELPAAYAAADAILLSSESETWGLVVNEAMACDRPAIVSAACGCAPDLIDPGATGFTFPCGDLNALARAMKEVIDLTRAGHDWGPALERKMRDYSVEACTDGTLGAVRRVLTSDDEEP